jgi:hypothetical protein
LNEKRKNKDLNGANPKIIWTEDKEIVERKPPNEKIIFYSLNDDNEK